MLPSRDSVHGRPNIPPGTPRIAGFGVRVRPSGHRSYVWQGIKDGRPARITIGPVALIAIEEARRDCLALMAQEGSGDGKADAVVPLFSAFTAGPWKRAFPRPLQTQAAYRPCPGTREKVAAVIRCSAARLRLVASCRDLVQCLQPGCTGWCQPNAGNVAQHHEVCRCEWATSVAIQHGALCETSAPSLTRFLSRQEIARLYKTLDRMVAKRPSCQPQADMIRSAPSHRLSSQRDRQTAMV